MVRGNLTGFHGNGYPHQKSLVDWVSVIFRSLTKLCLVDNVGGFLLSQILFVLGFSKDAIFLPVIFGMRPSLDRHPIHGEVFSMAESLLRLVFVGELLMVKRLKS